MAEMPLLQCDGLTVRYRDRAAVRDVSFSVLPGQAVAVVGESGSGKSTLLRAVMGLAGPGSRVEGSVRFAGQELAGLSPGALRQLRGPGMGMVFQDTGASLCPVRTIGSQMFECLAAHRRISRREAKRLALDLFARLDLPDGEALWHSLPGALSGGMLQRVGIAMALLPRPALLLADEPTSALDVLARRQVVAELARARQLAGTAILLVTHDFAVAEALADRMVVLDRGRVAESGPAEQVLRHPESEVTRRLLAAVPRLHRGTDQRRWADGPSAAG